MKKRFPLLTGFVLLLAGSVLFIMETDLLPMLSRRLYDAFLNKTAVPVQSDAVVIIDIDDDSLERYGQWPWPRTRLSRMVSSLWDQGAAVVVFDIIFIEPDRISPEVTVATWSEELGVEPQVEGIPDALRDFDALFAEVLSGGASVLGCFLSQSSVPLDALPESEDSFFRGRFYERGQSNLIWLPQAGGALHPLPVLARAAAGQAFINTLPDRDNIIRRTPLVFAYGPGRIYPSLALEAIRLYVQAPHAGIVYDSEGIDGVRHIQIYDGIIPTDAHGRMMLNYRSTRFPHLSAVDVIEGHVATELIEGRIVFVGTSAAGLQDLVSTPLASDFPGVEVHATVVDNILAGDILREPRWAFWVSLLTLLVGGAVLTLLVSFTPALSSFLVMLLADATVLAAGFWLFRERQLVVMPAEIVVIWGLVFIGVIGVKYAQEERGRKQIRGMFGTMVSPDVLSYLEQNPGSFSLTGARAEATMFFSDVAGFTTISESLEPARLAELLNRYLSPMTGIIMARGGYVDKYEGDAIMAEWGVPFPQEDHAVQACLAALEQQEKLAELRAELKEEFGHDLDVRMGINTGTVTAGNMGSETRFQYTVMGDAVNQAARFESANKCYGSLIMIGEATCDVVKGQFEVRLLDLIVVKGKTKPIRIYELLARAGELDEEKRQAVALYESALELHWERRFDEAIVKLDEAFERFRDEPSYWLRERIRGYREAPPPESWNGEFVNPTK